MEVHWYINDMFATLEDNSDPVIGLKAPQRCPGAPSVGYTYPVDWLYHRITLTTGPGGGQQWLKVQATWDSWDPSPDVIHKQGISAPFYVEVSGSRVTWLEYLWAPYIACLVALWEILRKYAVLAHVKPGHPVEFLRSLPKGQLVLCG